LFDKLQVVFLSFDVFVFNRMRHNGLLLLVCSRIMSSGKNCIPNNPHSIGGAWWCLVVPGLGLGMIKSSFICLTNDES